MEEQTNPTQKVKGGKTTGRFYALLSFIVFVVLVVVISVAVNHHNNQQSKSHVAEVRITQKGFDPATLVVKPDTQVVWINTDTSLHQVVANPYPTGKDLPGLKSAILNNNQKYTYLANKTGSFGYHDQMHPTINGTIVIQK